MFDPNARNQSFTKDFVIAVLLFVGAIAFFSSDWLNGMGGGVSTVGAERILAGQVPYRDFWTMYAPGHFYLSALIFSIFGNHILVDWISGSVVTAGASCACYYLARNVANSFAAILCACIFLAAMYNTGYFKHLGSYPPSALLIFTSLLFVAYYFASADKKNLFWAGLLTGIAIVIKHDVGGYTVIATSFGIIVYASSNDAISTRQRFFGLAKDLSLYAASCLIVALPLAIYFAIVAGPDMLQNLVVFPMTDFPFSRPESYPGISPSGIFENLKLSKMLPRVFSYLSFNLPLLFLSLGIGSLAVAIRKRLPVDAGLSAIFCVLFVFHYFAAHVQINTHIVSMSVYGFLLALLFYRVVIQSFDERFVLMRRFLATGFAIVWLASLSFSPLYERWSRRRIEKTVLDIPKISGTKLTPEEAQPLSELWNFVNSQIPPGEPIYVGNNRHDVILISDYMLYFILDRPGATRYDELHPAIADTSAVQREIIGDLQRKGVRLLVLKRIFSDARLEELKKDFQRNLPNVGATDLDDFIRNNYNKTQQFGPYEVWLLKPA